MVKDLILAVDLLNAEKAVEIAERVAGSIDYIKVNYPLVLSSGIGVVKDLSRIKPVIADFKIADIPYTATLISEIAFSYEAKAVIAHGFCGIDVLRAVLNVSRNYGGEVYVVTELSNPGAAEFMSANSEKIAVIAEKLGCHGLIAPATRIERLRRIREVSNLKIYSPGIGFQGGSFEALEYVDGIIVGRSIYLAESPEKAAEDFRRKLDGV